jgi:hypothetical protein
LNLAGEAGSVSRGWSTRNLATERLSRRGQCAAIVAKSWSRFDEAVLARIYKLNFIRVDYVQVQM